MDTDSPSPKVILGWGDFRYSAAPDRAWVWEVQRYCSTGPKTLSPSFPAVPLGKAMLLLDVQMACKSPLYIALLCYRLVSFAAVKLGTLVQNLGTRMNWLIPGLPRFLSKSPCHIHFYFWLGLEMSIYDKTGHFVTWILPPFIKWELLCLFTLECQRSLIPALSTGRHPAYQWFSDQGTCLGCETLQFKISICSGGRSEQFHFALNIH